MKLIVSVLLLVNSVAMAGPMLKSKKEIRYILELFQDKEGAVIKRITRDSSGFYTVDILTKSKKCLRHEIKIDEKKKRALLKPEVTICD